MTPAKAQHVTTHRVRHGLLALLAAALASLGGASGAHAATITISESAQLHLTSHRGFTLNEQGTTAGTINGIIYLHLHVNEDNRVTAELSIYPRGGSITGYASASYRATGPTATFNGTVNITRGTGTYSHAKGTGLKFTGAIQRVNDKITVHLSGRLSP
jgi:hypothetical protein